MESSEKAKILVFGSCNIDHVYGVAHTVARGETQAALSYDRFAGGKGYNQAIAVAKAGADACFAGCIGGDGTFLLDMLCECGVDISAVRISDVNTGHAIIQVGRDGDNSIIVFPGANGTVDEEYVKTTLDSFGDGDILLVQNEISCLNCLIAEAYGRKMRVILNPSPCNEVVRSIDLGMISDLILNEVEALQLSGCDSEQKAIDYFTKKYPDMRVVLTLGSRGCILAHGDVRISVPAYNVCAVDTTAAGDTFTGYYVAGVARGDGMENVLRLACAAAAISVTRRGAAPSIPKADEVRLTIGKLSLACEQS